MLSIKRMIYQHGKNFSLYIVKFKNIKLMNNVYNKN